MSIDLRYKGYSYEVIIKPWKKGNKRYEVIRWMSGFRNLWERISYADYLKVKSDKIEKL